jgi:hypothetical protein
MMGREISNDKGILRLSLEELSSCYQLKSVLLADQFRHSIGHNDKGWARMDDIAQSLTLQEEAQPKEVKTLPPWWRIAAGKFPECHTCDRRISHLEREDWSFR